MVNMISTLLVFIVLLAAFFGALCSITGEEKKGNQIVVNCITAMVLYMIILQLFNTGISNDSVFESGIPLINNVEKYGSVKEYIANSPALFALDFVELVTLTLLIHWISGVFSFSDAGFAGKVVTRIIIVFAGVIVYGMFMDFARDNVVMKWCVYCVECIITGGSILYTPIMIVSFFTGLKKDNMVLTYFIQQFPGTSIGKAISTAITSSIMFIALMLVLESQYGSVCDLLQGAVDSMESMGVVIIMIIGLYILVNSIKKKD